MQVKAVRTEADELNVDKARPTKPAGDSRETKDCKGNRWAHHMHPMAASNVVKTKTAWATGHCNGEKAKYAHA